MNIDINYWNKTVLWIDKLDFKAGHCKGNIVNIVKKNQEKTKKIIKNIMIKCSILNNNSIFVGSP